MLPAACVPLLLSPVDALQFSTAEPVHRGRLTFCPVWPKTAMAANRKLKKCSSIALSRQHKNLFSRTSAMAFWDHQSLSLGLFRVHCIRTRLEGGARAEHVSWGVARNVIKRSCSQSFTAYGNETKLKLRGHHLASFPGLLLVSRSQTLLPGESGYARLAFYHLTRVRW